MDKKEIFIKNRTIEPVNIDNLNEYNCFIELHPMGHIFQKLEWAKVKEPSMWEGFLCRNEQNKVVGCMGVMVLHLARNSYLLYVPRGPICNADDYDTIIALLSILKELTKKYLYSTIQIDSNFYYEQTSFLDAVKSCNFKIVESEKKFTTMQRQYVYRIDLRNRTIDDVFAHFHSNIRYSIRNAERKGVEVKICDTDKIFDFYHIMISVGCKDQFQVRSIDYYRSILVEFKENARLYIAYQNGIPIAGAIAVYCSKKMWYLYAGTNYLFKNLSPVNLVQWNIIKWAFEKHCNWYDLGGTGWINDQFDITPGLSYYKSKMGAERYKLTPGIVYPDYENCID